jgi:hypothetical protein
MTQPSMRINRSQVTDHLKTAIPFLLLIIWTLFVGCANKTRSISNSGYHNHYHGVAPQSRELDEFDVLGLNRNQTVTEEDILRASTQAGPVRLAPGSTILLVQSGAAYPDGPMVTELSKHFRVVPFSGIAAESSQPTADKAVIVVPQHSLARGSYRTELPRSETGAYSRLLRLAAARAGATTIVCYWGILESGTEALATKTVSWIPVMNWFVYDERQHMRIRLKMAVIDVPTGNWSVFSAQPLDDKSWSVRSRREVKDQQQVESLKVKAYALAARDLLGHFPGSP